MAEQGPMPDTTVLLQGQHPTIRLQVVLMLVGVWLAVSGFLIWDYRQELASGQQQSRTLSRSLATHAEQVLSDAQRLGYIIEDTVRLEGITAPVGRFMPTGSVNNQLILQLSLVDTQGVLRSSTTPGFQAIDLSDREHIRIHLKEGYRGLFISKPLVGRASQRLSVQLTSPLEDANGRLLGVLVISIDPAQLTERYRKLNIGPNGLIALTGTQDHVIRLVRSNTPIPGLEPGMRNKSLLDAAEASRQTESLAAAAHQDGSVWPASSNFKPDDLLLSATEIPGYPLTVVVGLAAADFLAPFYKRRAMLLAATIVLSFLALIAELRHARLTRQARESGQRLSEALAQVLARERRFADLFRAIPDPVIAFSKAQRCATGFNLPMSQLLEPSGLSLDDIDTRHFAQAVFASDVSPERTQRQQFLCNALNKALDATPLDSAVRFEIQLDTPAPVIYEVRIKPMPDEPVGLLVALRDITAQHRLELMTNDFAATAAHEMRTPLASILGFSELLAAGLVPEEERTKISEQIYQRARNMSELVNDLLTLTRLETGRGGGQFTTLDLCNLPAALLQQLPEAANHLEIDMPAQPVLVAGNLFELLTALRNAVENALKYGEPAKGVLLRIWADVANGQARIVVADQGQGVTQQDLDRVFKRFIRLDHAGNPEGSGLGLPLIRGVLQHHKGWAWAESSPGEGFRLHMALPLLINETRAPNVAPRESAPEVTLA